MDNIDSTLQFPNHIAVIMDGNGRWAKQQGKPRIFGHEAGMNNVKNIALAANEFGVKIMTLFAFSTENWQRPTNEVKFLMKLPIDFFGNFMPDLMSNNVQVRTIGEIDELPAATQKAIQKAKQQTQNNTGLILNFAMNYSGKSEILRAVKSIVNDIQNEELNKEDISVETIDQHLFTAQFGNLADPDLIIRTSGEQRISNFLLWQGAYSEYFFTDKMWPEFSKDDLKNAIIDFQKRGRRFGKVTEE